ncbi:phosphoglycerate kinase [Candidatus Parcubacteria bacterium]|nr:phosphoglycerate kinase [Candidatus Parcubacteria bacterium]
MKTIKDFDVNNKRVLVRVGFNVPLNEQGGILDNFRLEKSLPTIKYLIEKGAKVVLISHLGRPETRDNKYSLKFIALRLSELLNRPVKFLDDCVGEKVEQEIANMKQGDVILLENLRFYKEETENNLEFAEKLAKLGDIFVQDAFSVCHREHSSIIGIPKFLPSGIGLLAEQEIKILKELRETPQKPLKVLIGGVKAKTKIKALDKISEIADEILIGHLIQQEIKEQDFEIKNSQKIVEPVDSLRLDDKDLDIGPKTIDLFEQKIFTAKTIFWNGPLGLTDDKRFIQGSLAIAKAIIASGAYSIVGGGDTVLFLGKQGLRDKFNFVSTGGGAMLLFLCGKPLPGIEAIK